MGDKRRIAILLGMGLCLVVAGLVGIRVFLRPPPATVTIEPPPPPKQPSLPPGRVLQPPASTTPDKVDTAVLAAKDTAADLPGAGEGLVETIQITTPPFTIDKRYRSMEGPYAEYKVRLDGAGGHGRELLWWKGAKIEVLDEAGKVIGQEFMCHLNVDVNPDERGKLVGMRPATKRLLTLTQGELAFALPKGHALPVASDETWSIMFQVLNHNRDGVFQVRQRLTLYFLRDADLFSPLDPVAFYAGSVWVSVDKATPEALALDQTTCHCCAPLERGLEATNNIAMARQVDDAGRTLVGHWVVPPGKSTWASPLARYMPASDKPRQLYATWTHVHPFATEVRLVEHKPGCAPETLARSSIESLHDGKVGLSRIASFADAKGVTLAEKATFELAVDYDNTSGRAMDSMTSLGMFTDTDWQRPAWAARAQNGNAMDASCGAN